MFVYKPSPKKVVWLAKILSVKDLSRQVLILAVIFCQLSSNSVIIGCCENHREIWLTPLWQ